MNDVSVTLTSVILASVILTSVVMSHILRPKRTYGTRYSPYRDSKDDVVKDFTTQLFVSHALASNEPHPELIILDAPSMRTARQVLAASANARGVIVNNCAEHFKAIAAKLPALNKGRSLNARMRVVHNDAHAYLATLAPDTSVHVHYDAHRNIIHTDDGEADAIAHALRCMRVGNIFTLTMSMRAGAYGEGSKAPKSGTRMRRAVRLFAANGFVPIYGPYGYQRRVCDGENRRHQPMLWTMFQKRAQTQVPIDPSIRFGAPWPKLPVGEVEPVVVIKN